MLAVLNTLQCILVQMIVSSGKDVKPLASFPTPSDNKLVGDVKEPTSLFEKSRVHSPQWHCVLFMCIHGLGGLG